MQLKVTLGWTFKSGCASFKKVKIAHADVDVDTADNSTMMTCYFTSLVLSFRERRALYDDC